MLTKADLKLPEESLRLEIKELAERERVNFSKKGISDIFDILSDVAFLIRKPLNTASGLSGFSFYYEDQLIVFLNSSVSLGHERFTGAHELYHLTFNLEILKKEKILLNKEDFDKEDERANIFAAEFLMPEDYVRKTFLKIIKVDADKVLPRHVVIMHNYFKVSYKAMLKRLIQLNLCSLSKYKELEDICTIEKSSELQKLEVEIGYSTELILPSNITYISPDYLAYMKSNFIDEKISPDNFNYLLSFLGLSSGLLKGEA